MPCKILFKLTHSTFPKKLSLIFYDKSYYKKPGKQLHIVCHSPCIPKLASDRIKFNDKGEWDHLCRFLRAVKDCPNQVELKKIPGKDPVQYETIEHERSRRNPPTGLRIPFDHNSNWRSVLLTFPVIDEILQYEESIKNFFDNGLLSQAECNCQEWTDHEFIGECLNQIKEL